GGRPRARAGRTAVPHEGRPDEPLPVRYWDWLAGVLHGNLGTSMVTQQSVASRVGAGLGTTSTLVCLAMVVVVAVGVALGVATALRPGAVDAAANAATAVSVTIPPFVA